MTMPTSLFRSLCRLFLALACTFTLPAAHAHKASDSYLNLRVTDRHIEGQWDIALRDLDVALGLDADGNGELTWDEVRARHADIAAYAMSRLSLASNDASCPVAVTRHMLDDHTDGAYAVIRFAGDCPHTIDTLDIRYRLLFEFDPLHKGLLRLEHADGTETAIFEPEHDNRHIVPASGSPWTTLSDYFRHGVRHIWIGIDHILFLLSLLLPAVFCLSGRQWKPAPDFRTGFIDVLKIVSAFTLAHSMTLTLAALELVRLPSRWVESAIAASVVVAAVNNLLPVLHKRRWVAAFLFGLVHGFGFASVLADLGLPRTSLALALLGFNVGVEAGQLAIVAAFLPVAHAMRETWVYRRLFVAGGSTAIALVAAVWFVERAFDLRIFA
jgi:hypothetical protein